MTDWYGIKALLDRLRAPDAVIRAPLDPDILHPDPWVRVGREHNARV